jgi:hypothetical protein
LTATRGPPESGSEEALPPVAVGLLEDDASLLVDACGPGATTALVAAAATARPSGSTAPPADAADELLLLRRVATLSGEEFSEEALPYPRARESLGQRAS